MYSDRFFQPRRKQRNILDFHHSAKVNPQSESEALQIFMTDDILLQIQRYTNKKRLELWRLSPAAYGFMSAF